jgi:cell division septal protein FtsQ
MNPLEFDRAVLVDEELTDGYEQIFREQKRFSSLRSLQAAVVALFLALIVLFISKGSSKEGVVGRLGDGIFSSWYDKQVFISGDSPYDDIELEAKLPMARSVLWWYFSRDEIESSLLTDPRITSVRLESCSETFDPGCFDLTVEKREGRFIVEVNEAPWLVSSDGVFLSLLPVTEDQYQDITDAQGEPLVTVLGELFHSISPDLVRAEIQFLDRATRLIERKVKRDVSRLIVESDGDLRVEFKEYEGEVVFSGTGNLADLSREVHRLALLLQRIGVEKSIDTIDLSFENLAVVKLRPLR